MREYLHRHPWIWQTVLGAAASLFGLWLMLAVVLFVIRPKGASLMEVARLLPDTARLLRRLAADPDTSRPVRCRIGFLLVYLAMPIDLIPDFIPVIGHVDDAIIAIIVLRSVLRRVHPEKVRAHWPGTSAGLATLFGFAGVPGRVELS